MNAYEQLPTDSLIFFYHEIIKNIEKGRLSKNMYYELGLIISVASRRGVTLSKPWDFDQVVDHQALDNFTKFAYRHNINYPTTKKKSKNPSIH